MIRNDTNLKYLYMDKEGNLVLVAKIGDKHGYWVYMDGGNSSVFMNPRPAFSLPWYYESPEELGLEFIEPFVDIPLPFLQPIVMV